MKSVVLQSAMVFSLLAAAASAGPNVTLVKKCPNLRYLGRNATFELTVSNQGDAAAQNVIITDTIAGSVQFIKADGGGVREGDRIIWRLGTLDAGQTRSVTVDVLCNAIGTVRNMATVSYCAEQVAECELQVKGIPAILLECVDSPDPIELNGTLTYTIAVTNQGTAVGTNIKIKCLLPAQEEYVSSEGPTTAQVTGKEIVFAPLASLAPLAKTDYKVTVKGIDTGDVRFRVELNSDQIDSPVMETESTHIYN